MIIVEKHILEYIAFITDRVMDKYGIDIYEDCIKELDEDQIKMLEEKFKVIKKKDKKKIRRMMNNENWYNWLFCSKV